MNTRANIEKWVAALRSGEYAQGRGLLRSEDGYCCLGVLCDVFMKETGEGEWADPLENGDLYFRLDNESEGYFPPQRVYEWAGLVEKDGSYTDLRHLTSLVDLNDNRVPFEEIANVIESEPAGLLAL